MAWSVPIHLRCRFPGLGREVDCFLEFDGVITTSAIHSNISFCLSVVWRGRVSRT
jgi:hypothetical protein